MKIELRGVSYLPIVKLNLKLEVPYIYVKPTGEGKSTFLKLIYGELLPEEGEVLVDGISTRNVRFATLRQAIGYSGEKDLFIEENTLDEHLELLSLLNKNVWEEADRLMVKFGLSVRRNYMLCEISKREREKFKLIVAILKGKKLILLDEPFLYLTTDEKVKLWHILIEKWDDGVLWVITQNQHR